MRAYGYLQMILIISLTSSILVSTALINWVGGVYDSLLDYITAYYYNWLMFGAMGALGGIIFGLVGAIGVYSNCRLEKIDAFSWPSEKERRKAYEDTKVGFYCTLVTLGMISVFIIVDRLAGQSWIAAMTNTLNMAAILAWFGFVIITLTVIPSLLVDIICGNFLQRLLQELLSRF